MKYGVYESETREIVHRHYVTFDQARARAQLLTASLRPLQFKPCSMPGALASARYAYDDLRKRK